MGQSSALEPGDFCFPRIYKRKTTAILASAMKMALVAIVARDAEVVMMESGEMPFERCEGEKRIWLKSVYKNEWMTRVSEMDAIYKVAPFYGRSHVLSEPCGGKET